MPTTPRVFTIPASAPFLPTLARALIDGKLVDGFSARDPLALARATIYLPTRRACRLARDVFLETLDTEAAVLPRIVALGDIDEDEFAFADTGGAALDLPPALAGFERRALLAKLILKWAEQLEPVHGEPPLIVNSPATALALADDLARLMDDFATRQVPWDRLDGLVPDDLDKYWQETLKFLSIVRKEWPGVLAKLGAIEPAEHRDRLIAAERARLKATPDSLVIAAGSTGSMPATAELLATIATLPNGALVLPGLDTDLDDEAWTLIAGKTDSVLPAASHPQFAMQALLARLGIDRREVTALGPPASRGREALTSEILRPAAATDMWRARLADTGIGARVTAGFDDLAVVEAANAEEEALAIAVALREMLEHADKTAALVTPDRALARRVAVALGRWGIAADDSGGDPLAATQAGLFARLVADAALGGLAPVPLLAMLKHPLLRLDAGPGAHRHAIVALERAVLRGSRPRAGSAGLAAALASTHAEWEKLKRKEASELHHSDPRAALSEADFHAAAKLAAKLADALAPLESLAAEKTLTLAAIARGHQQAIELMTREGGEAAGFKGNDGVELTRAFEAITAQDDADIALTPDAYADMFLAAISDRIVRRPGTPGARVRIFGPLEARLTESDRVVLGGLVEGVWPPDARSDPWLSRPMRSKLGLDLPERRIGLSAHDFAQLMGAKDVVLTRATKLAGAPTVASRFLHRLAAVAGEARWERALAGGEKYLAWARALDQPVGPPRPIARPAPKPPRAARPTSLSVTEIEHWLRDPYTIYAKHILRLVPLDPVDMEPGGAERGSAIHNAIGEFAKEFASKPPADPYAELLRIGRRHFAPLEDYPQARAFWWPRFERIARWFAGWEAKRRAQVADMTAEISGQIDIPLGERSFTLRARADRVEQRADGAYAILDYKTGRIPGHDEVKVGFAPQLTLEAAILRGGGFANIASGASVAELVYIALKGGRPGGKEQIVKLKDSTPDAAADAAMRKLTGLAVRFEDEAEAYRSLVNPMFKTRYGDYDHLARVKEWTLAGEDDEEGGPE